MVDQGALAGSGGYHRPCSARTAFRSLFTTPGCTTQIRFSGSISTMAFIRDRSRIRQPSTAFAPPDRPVPAPRVTIGTPRPAAIRTAAATSVSLRARTATSARPTAAHCAWSADRPVDHRRIDNDAVGGNLATERGEQVLVRRRDRGHPTAPASSCAVALAPFSVMMLPA